MTAKESDVGTKILENLLENFESLCQKYPHLYREKLRGRIDKIISKDFEKGLPLLKMIASNKNKTLHKNIISQNILLQIIPKVPSELSALTEKDKEYSGLYFSLEHCAEEATRRKFINRQLEVIKANPAGALNGPQRFAFQQLEKAALPNSLDGGGLAEEFYNAITNCISRMTDPNEKLIPIGVSLRYLPILPENLQEKFVKERLTPDINSHDHNFSIKIAEFLNKIPDEVEVVAADRIWAALKDKSLQSLNSQLIDIIFEHYIKDKETLSEYFKSILNANPRLAVDTLNKNKDRIPKPVINAIFNNLLEKSKSVPPDQAQTIFEAITGIFPKLAQENRDKFGGRLQELIAEYNNPQLQVVGLETLDKVKDNLSDVKKKYMANQLALNLPRPARDHDINSIDNIFQGIFRFEPLLSEAKKGVIDYALPMAIEDNPETYRLKGFEYLRKMGAIPRAREESVTQQLFDVLKTSERDSNIFNQCKETLSVFRTDGKRKDFWDQVDKFLQPEQ